MPDLLVQMTAAGNVSIWTFHQASCTPRSIPHLQSQPTLSPLSLILKTFLVLPRSEKQYQALKLTVLSELTSLWQKCLSLVEVKCLNDISQTGWLIKSLPGNWRMRIVLPRWKHSDVLLCSSDTIIILHSAWKSSAPIYIIHPSLTLTRTERLYAILVSKISILLFSKSQIKRKNTNEF